ncbi:hypothetical protein [Streptomyces collinus]
MDQQIVEVGDGSRTIVESEVAADPEALRALCAQGRERNGYARRNGTPSRV